MNVPEGFSERLGLLERGLERLPDKPDETAESTLRALWALAQNHRLALNELAAHEIASLTDEQAGRLSELIDKRLSGVPLAHLTGRQHFMGIVLMASPAALVPRSETELLGRAALEKVKACSTEHPLIVDACTGAGNVALALAVHAPSARVLGADLAPDAVSLARDNADFVGRPDVEFRCGDLLKPFGDEDLKGRVDVLTCNPPYISSAKVPKMAREISAHEPGLAFDGGAFGINIIRRLIADAPGLLRPAGWLMLEVGLGQGTPMEKILQRDAHYDRIETHTNDEGEIRVLAARRTVAEG